MSIPYETAIGVGNPDKPLGNSVFSLRRLEIGAEDSTPGDMQDYAFFVNSVAMSPLPSPDRCTA
ncbi:MAG: hypothetical protein FWB78_12635, partial [Treponema sp.]|nr:hypothetical protein [Treponema sp.]